MIRVGEETADIDLSKLTVINNARLVTKLLIVIALITVFVTLVLLTRGALLVLSMILLGLMYAHAVELQHQCLHNTGFRSRRLNRGVGIVLGLPQLVSFSDYQSSHFQHHKLLGTPEDREFFNYGYEALTSLKSLIPHLLMLRHYWDVAVNISKSLRGLTRTDVPARAAQRIRTEYLIMAGFLFSIAAITVAFNSLIFLKIWLLPLLIAIPTHALIELPEHIGCENQTNDVLRNTRTIKASRFGVPELHKKLETRIAHLESSYVSFYWWFLRQLFYGTLQTRRSLAKGVRTGAQL